MSKIISLATAEIKDVSAPLINNQREYAAKFGYEYECYEKRVLEDFHPSFSKVPLILQALKDNHEYVVWMDADAAFSNFTRDIKDILANKLVERPDLFLTGKQQASWRAWKYICNGVLCLRNTPYAHKFVETWLDHCINGTPNVEPGKRVFITSHPYEQFSFDGYIRATSYHGIYAANGPEIGSFAKEIWSDGEDWLPGFLTIHLAGPASYEMRAKVFRQVYQPQIVY